MNLKDRIEVVEGNITKQHVDAVVNAANESLLGGGGVDGAIHRTAGPELLAECRKLGGCPTGSAKITKGYGLPAKFIIHTVGPIWRGGDKGESELLVSCYQQSLALAVKSGVRSIAFPAISTGAYRFPIDEASLIAVRTTKKFLESSPGSIERVLFVCYGHDACSYYFQALQEVFR
jgi:O-acetyl-ADP-ribose deacetylase (regulator of RNase III)